MRLNEYADALMIAYKNGDHQALEEIYVIFREPLYSFIYRYTKDEQFSIDIVQDTFVNLQRHKHQYDQNKGRLKSYLFQIAYRLMVTKLNRRKRWREKIPFLVRENVETIERAEHLDVQQAITNLSGEQRAVILLFYYHDLPQKEIATILNIPLGTVKSRLSAAIQKLRKDLGVEEDES